MLKEIVDLKIFDLILITAKGNFSPHNAKFSQAGGEETA